MIKTNYIVFDRENKDEVKTACDIFDKIKDIKIDYNQEHFFVFVLNTRLKILDVKPLFVGGLSECSICPLSFYRSILNIDGSKSVIIAHNHPSDVLTPSDEDLRTTKDLKEGCDLLGLSLLDSIIFNKTEYFSLKESGLL